MIDNVLDALNQPAFQLFGAPTSWAEIAGFLTGAVCVWLVAVQHVWNWPIGIANGAFFLLLFATAGLYADAGLQIFYISMGFYGWWAWMRGGKNRTELEVSQTTAGQWMILAAVGVVAAYGLWALLVRVSDSNVPIWDAVTTVLSLLATWGQARKKVESWFLWIAADIIYIPLLAYKGLVLTGMLYGVFMALCVCGLISWRRDLRAGANQVPENPLTVAVPA